LEMLIHFSFVKIFLAALASACGTVLYYHQ